MEKMSIKIPIPNSRLSQSISDGFQQSPMQCTVVALIDYSRAYDKVRRDALLTKISQKGIQSHGMMDPSVAFQPTDQGDVSGVRSQTVRLKEGVM